MDYRKFLKPTGDAATEEVVLPYFGGSRVDAAKRSYAVEAEPVVGWWHFGIQKRAAVPIRRAEASELPDLSKLPALRGHYAHDWVIASGRERARLAIAPDDEPAPLSRVTARRWYSGEYLFDGLDFDDDPELRARDALEQRRALPDDLKGVTPSLRIAFGFALGMAAAQDLDIPMSPIELAPIAIMIADGGVEVVRQLFDDLVEERRMAIELARLAAEQARERARLQQVVGKVRARERSKFPRQRVDEILRDAQARMVACTNLQGGRQLDVVYTVDGVRIHSIVDADSLQVIDPGICLAGAHRVLTLDAMPSVVREAIEVDHLNITRRD